MRSAISQLLVTSDSTNDDEKKLGLLQRFRSLGEHLHITGSSHNEHTPVSSSKKTPNSPQTYESRFRKCAISTSTGYLNVKDVFLFPGSITALPEYKQDQQRFRSVSSLQQPVPSHHTSTVKIEANETQQVGVSDLKTGYGSVILNGESSKTYCGTTVRKEESNSITSSTKAIEIWR